MEKFGILVNCVIFLLTSRTTRSFPIDEAQIRQLENQIYNIEEKLDNEAKIRRESVITIMNKLYELRGKDAKNNKDQLPNADLGQDLGHDRIEAINQDSMVHALLVAFGDEKMNNRRVERDLKSLLETNDKRVHRNLDDLQRTISDIIQSNIDILNNVKELNQVFDRLEKSRKQSSKEILNRFNFTDILVNLKGITVEMFEQVKNQNRKFESCVDIYQKGFTKSGLYDIYPDKRTTPLRVYCDQNTDGGGWIVFQRREDGTENFYRNWLDYKFGFGNPEGEFWLGNEYLHLLTSSCCHELRIDMEDFENERRYAQYSNFSIGSKATNYKLTIQSYSGDADDSLSSHSGYSFSTHDKDNDIHSSNCAVSYKGAWWYTKCHSSNLNGQYLGGEHESYADGVNWYTWKKHHYSLKIVEMKLR